MKPGRFSALRGLSIVPNALLWFVSALVPVIFLFAVIAAFDQAAQHRGLLAALDEHGRETQAVISTVDFEASRGYIFLSYPIEDGKDGFAVIRTLELYPADWLQSLAPGQAIDIVYVAASPHRYNNEAVPRAYYPDLQRNPGITRDIIGLFLFFLAVAIFRPHFIFLGVVSYDQITLAPPPQKPA